jgi:hypothetical protein
MLQNFAGCADTETVDASSTTAAFTLGFESNDVLITVDSDVTAFFVFGSSAQTATIAGATHHMGKGTATFSKPRGHKYGAVILASGTAKIYLTPGNGA